MTASAADDAHTEPEHHKGQLLATRLVLHEALDRLTEDQLGDLQVALDRLVSGLREQWSDELSPEQAAIVDEVEAIALWMRYRDQHIEATEHTEREYAAVCMKCDAFPLEIGSACPVCETERFLTTVRI